MPSRAVGDAQAVTSTADSPMRTITEPSACFAYLPVSNERAVLLIVTSCLCISELIDDWVIGKWAI
jgi:hypothetical protein